MKAIYSLFAFAFIIMGLSSCEKVIDVDLNNAAKRYVVEAIITDQAGSAMVLISQTKNFDEDNTFPGIPGATVTVTETGGSVTSFTETSTGVYQAPAFAGTPGNEYQLSVVVGSETFTAICRMPLKVNFDSLFVSDEFLFSDTRKIANVVFKDPPGRGQHYRHVQYVNGMREKQIFIQNDDYTDGRTVDSKLFYFTDDDETDSQIKSGDILRVEMQCIDPEVYKYWFSLVRSSTGGSQQATPSNPVSNMKGGALGYFSAHTQQSRSITVP